MEQPTRLTFKALNERIDGIPDHPSAVMEPSPKEKYGYATALLAVALCFLAMKVLPDDRWYTVAIAGFFFLVEMMAVVVALLPKWPPRLPGFRADRNEYAEQLDYDFEHYGNLIAWIATHPREQIAALADYAELRQDRFREKQPLLIGSIEKLGVLPILVAIAAQFKGMRWPPAFTWPEIALYLFAAWFYWLCLISIGTRHRGRFLEIVLKRALVAKDQECGDSQSPEPNDGVLPQLALAGVREGSNQPA